MIQTRVLFAMMAFTGLLASAAIVDVKTLNQNLKKNKQRWQAKDTWLNQLSPVEIKRMMNAPTTDSDVEFVSSDDWVQEKGVPRTLDWRNKDGKNWVSPILNQGACGSCVAFAAIATMETQTNISALLPNLNVRLSPQHLFSCGGGVCGWGWQVDPAAQFLKKKGVVDQACMPYVSGATGLDVSCKLACPDSAQRSMKIADFKKPTFYFKNLNAVKRALQKGPLVATMQVFADFLTYSSGVYKRTTLNRMGGHAISIVGYDDNKQALIIRNSWGTEWGENGFAYIDYKDASGVGAMTWSFEVPAIDSVVTVESPRDKDYFSESIELTSSNNISSADRVKYTIIKPDGSEMTAVETQEKETRLNLNTSDWSDGRYQVRADVLDKKSRILARSSYQYFYVVNTVPQMSVRFKGVDVDLAQTLKGRVVFEVTSLSSSVPMSQMEFHFKDQNGKETTRSTSTVVETMETGWKTELVPNGVYEIWFTGRIKTNHINAIVESERRTVTVLNK